MKKILLLLLLTCSTVLTIIAQSTPKPFTVVASGDVGPERRKIALVAFNKYYNLELHPASFRSDYNLDTIDYKKNYTVQLYMGELYGIGHKLTLDSIIETDNLVEVSYSFIQATAIDSNRTTRPFLIATTPKVKKKEFVFIENGIRGGKPVNQYVK
jgi:hypothetical protein